MKKNKKALLKIIILLLILLIVFCIMLFFLKKQNNTQSDEEIQEEMIENYTSDKTIPRAMSTLYSHYKGNRSLNDLYRNLDVFVKYLPELSDNIYTLNETELKQYYSTNKNTIIQNLGIRNEESFIQFAQYINSYDLNGKEFNYCEIDKDTYRNSEEGYLVFNIQFYFNGIEKPLNLEIHFSNSEKTKTSVIYAPVV